MIIGLSSELLDLDIDSPFTTSPLHNVDLPISLQHTAVQMQQLHHPGIDLLPMPSLRDAILQYLLPEDLDRLCGDLFGQCGNGSRQVGLIAWGESWDPAAYEISYPDFMAWSKLFQH